MAQELRWNCVVKLLLVLSSAVYDKFDQQMVDD